MKDVPPHPLVAQCFSQAAPTYDSAALLQRGIAERLLALSRRHMPLPGHDHVWADLGCGTGYLTRRLQGLHEGTLLGIDLSYAMVSHARPRCLSQVQWIQANAIALPFAANSVDRLFSNLALQWAGDLDVVLACLFNVLKPGGWLAMTTLDANTLYEFNHVQRLAGGHDPGHRFATAAAISSSVCRSGFRIHAHLQQDFVRFYPSVHSLMRDLKRLGAQSRSSAPSGGLKGRHWLRALEHHSQSVLRPEGMPARYATHFLILQKPLGASEQELS